jgi:hypothetical protein
MDSVQIRGAGRAPSPLLSGQRNPLLLTGSDKDGRLDALSLSDHGPIAFWLQRAILRLMAGAPVPAIHRSVSRISKELVLSSGHRCGNHDR